MDTNINFVIAPTELTYKDANKFSTTMTHSNIFHKTQIVTFRTQILGIPMNPNHKSKPSISINLRDITSQAYK